MTDTPRPKLGHPVWFDLTVPAADPTRDFYADVLGWSHAPIDMGGYSDYVMSAPDGAGVAGVCHARGGNADMPPVWMVYFQVADVEAAVEAVRGAGGEVLKDPSRAGPGRYAVIRDPAGAVCALYETESE